MQTSEIVDELWDNNPPVSAMTTLQTYIYKLRRDVLARSDAATLTTKASGYVLDIPAEDVDVARFERLVVTGKEALGAGDPQRTSGLLTQALELWRGDALADVPKGEILSAYITHLEESRLRAFEMRIDAAMKLGRHVELVSDLKALVAAHPLHERFHADLMSALHRSGRRYEALEVYRRLREILVEELGVEPSSSVRLLHEGLLNADSDAEEKLSVSTIGYQEAPVVPAQLPPVVPTLVGRDDELKHLVDLLRDLPDEAPAARMLSISGMCGVGKSALALNAAHQARSNFPDGQLYADMNGWEDPASPWHVLAGFLRAVGVPERRIPQGNAELSNMFRTWCADRRALIVLDDVASPGQVAPILPASSRCAVVLTSRSNLIGIPGLIDQILRPLEDSDGAELLASVVGLPRVHREARTAARISELCGGLPLALHCVGARLAAMETWRLDRMADRLDPPARRLDELRFAGFNVRRALEADYRRLTRSDQSVLRLLAMLPQDFPADAVARLLGVDLVAAESHLARLVGQYMLRAKQCEGTGEVRYCLNELTRIHAREQLELELKLPARHS